MNYVIRGKKLIYNSSSVINYEDIPNKDMIEEIIIPEGVNYIDDEVFRDFTNLRKINLPKSLRGFGEYLFENCTNLESIVIPENVSLISPFTFYNCTSLKSIKILGNVTDIDRSSFENCISLKEFVIPESVEYIGSRAFFGCKKIKSIHIPRYTYQIDAAAFACMDSLERITVDSSNTRYISINNNSLIQDEDDILIQYAVGSKNKSFKLDSYSRPLNTDEFSIVNESNMIYDIADYAFANAKNLNSIELHSELDSIGANTFLGCDNLKKLRIYKSNFGRMLAIHFHNDGFTNNISIPFEEIVIGDGIREISSHMEELFKNAKIIDLPDSIEKIGTKAFSLNKNIKYFSFNNNITGIEPGVFNSGVLLHFSDFGNVMSDDFSTIVTKTSDSIDNLAQKKDTVKILTTKNNCFKIKYDDFDIVEISSGDIENAYNKGKLIANSPDTFIRHVLTILEYSLTSKNGINNMFTDKEFKVEYSRLFNAIDILDDIRNKKLQTFINRLLVSKGIHNEALFNGLIMYKCSKEDILSLADNMSESLTRFLEYNGFFNNLEFTPSQSQILSRVNDLVIYTSLLESKKMYNTFFYQHIFTLLNPDTVSLLIDNYNSNLKRCLYTSDSLDSISYVTNLVDLIKILKVLGAFEKDKIVSQKALTFFNEKIILDSDIRGDKLHTYFNEYNNPVYSKEYSLFFMENYKTLLELEKEHSGINARIYNEFEEIRNHSTSNRGSQRKLKVTIEKCLDYFLINKFDGFEEEYRELAEMLSKYFSNPETLNIAINILNNSKNAPRNIFSKYKIIDKDIVFINNPEDDLFKTLDNGYSYHWLPKNDLENFILGKYCNCCAHILGAGAGIMRASFESNDVQNLVIRNSNGLIIAKMTLYINRITGYGVFNTVEISESVNTSEYPNIYNAFIEGMYAFIDAYNKNNKVSINGISIGDKRNSFESLIKSDNLGDEVLYETLDYSKYQYKVNDISCGTYPGDALSKQLLIYKK